MAETKRTKRPTALKRDIRNEKRRQINRRFKSRVRTAIRALHDGIKEGKKEGLPELLNDVYSLMDKGVKRGTYKLNQASRVKSKSTAKVAAVLNA